MDQREVHLVGAQFGEAVLQACGELVGRKLFSPYLGGDEQVIARHSALGNGLADGRLVAVYLCGVDGAVAQRECVAHRVYDDLVLQAEGAQAEGGNGGRCIHGDS